MLKNKVIVITGGAGLIGREFVKTVLDNSGVAVIADVNDVSGLKLRDELADTYDNGKVDYINVNAVSIESLNSAISYLESKYKRIDALINNAYPRNDNYGKHFFDVEYSDFVENLGSNLGGCFVSSQVFAKYFYKQGYGNIINLASIYGVIAPRFEVYENTHMTMPVEYAAIKPGMIHLTKYMAKYFKGKNIRVNAISPGGIMDAQPESFLERYSQHCLTKGMLDKCDLNGTLLYLLSDMSKFVNGQNIIVDDGFVL